MSDSVDFAIIIPFRDRGTDPLRAANLKRVLEWWDGLGAPVLVVDDGREGDAQFNRSAAYNRGAAATDADVLVYTESDILIPRKQVYKAAVMAAGQPGMVIPFTDYCPLSPADSEWIRVNEVDPAGCVLESRAWSEVGPSNVVSRATLEAVGGFDEGFEGHSCDDLAMRLAFELCAGPTRHVGGSAYHLHHLLAFEGGYLTEEDRAAIAANRERWGLYQRVRDMAAAELRQFTLTRFTLNR